MIKIAKLEQVLLPVGVSVDTVDWYWSTKADFSDEALPTEEGSSDLLLKEFEYDFYEDTIIYMKGVVNTDDGKTYNTNIIVFTKHYKKVLLNSFVYAPKVNVTMRQDRMGAQISINEPVFYFETDAFTSTSWKVMDTNGNTLYSRMYDKDNKTYLDIPLSQAKDYDALVFCARYEFADTVEDVWGKKVVVLEEEKLSITLSEITIYRGETSRLQVLNHSYQVGNLNYHIETLRGKEITSSQTYVDGVYFRPDVVEDSSYVNVVFTLVDSIYGLIKKTVRVKVLGERIDYIRTLVHNPTILVYDGLSPDKMNQLHIENKNLLDLNSNNYIDLYKLSSDGIVLQREDLYYLNNYNSDFNIYYCSDTEILVTYINTDNDTILLFLGFNNDLIDISSYTIEPNSLVTIRSKVVYYKANDKLKTINLSSGDSETIDGDFDEIDDVLYISPISDDYFVLNMHGEMYNTNDTNTVFEYSTIDVDRLLIYPTHTGINIVYYVEADNKIIVKHFDKGSNTFTTLKDMDGDGNDYSTIYDLRKQNIILMKE